MGIAQATIPFRVWSVSSYTPFRELSFNGLEHAYDAATDNWSTTQNNAPAEGVAANTRNGLRIGMNVRWKICIDAGTGRFFNSSDQLVGDVKAICCRFLVIQVFGDTDSFPREGIHLHDFFASNNITSYMRSNIGDVQPQLKRFKVLIDKTFTTSELSAGTADRHMRLQFNQGTVTLSNGSNTAIPVKGSRIIYGLFMENIIPATATFSDVNGHVRSEICPSYYGDLKWQWWDVPN